MTTPHRTPSPRGATAAFVAAAKAKHGAPFVASWLSGRTCRFTDTTIFTLGLSVDKLRQCCERDLVKHGVTVKMCPDVTEGLRREIDTKAFKL